MKTTTNYALKKPDGTDVVSIDDFNVNSDIIDSKLKEIESNEIFYAVATGTANTYAISVSAIKSLYDGLAICPKINIASTGASTINVNGLGAKSIVDSLGNPITSGGLKANTPYTLRYNGVNFIVSGKGGGGNVVASQLLIGTTATGDSGAVVGTMANNGAVTITPGTTNQTIASGFHDGTGYIVGDSDLITGNIKAGVNLFGVVGKSSVVDTADGTTTADKILNTYTGYVNGAKVTGTMANNGAVTITPGTTAQSIGVGYHNGSGYVVGDSDLVSANIKSGVNIFGVAGSGTVVDTGDAVLDPAYLLTGYSGYDDGVKKAGAMIDRSNENWHQPALGETVSNINGYGAYIIPPAGYYNGSSWVRSLQADLVASNIVSGRNIFGVVGTANIGPQYASGYIAGTSATMTINLSFTPNVITGTFKKSGSPGGEIAYVSTALTGYTQPAGALSWGASTYGNVVPGTNSITFSNISTAYVSGIYWYALKV